MRLKLAIPGVHADRKADDPKRQGCRSPNTSALETWDPKRGTHRRRMATPHASIQYLAVFTSIVVDAMMTRVAQHISGCSRSPILETGAVRSS